MSNPAYMVHLKGDASLPEREGPKIIAHVCNNLGQWGSEFSGSLSSHSKLPETQYVAWSRNPETFRLGAVQFTPYFLPDTQVANLVVQDLVHEPADGEETGLDFSALERALHRVADQAYSLGASVHICRDDLASLAKWKDVEKIIQHTLGCGGVEVCVYERAK